MGNLLVLLIVPHHEYGRVAVGRHYPIKESLRDRHATLARVLEHHFLVAQQLVLGKSGLTTLGASGLI